MEPKQAESIYWLIWELIVHVFVGSALFALIFVPAIGLDYVLHLLKQNFAEMSETLNTILVSVKYAIAGLDALTYLILLVNMCWNFVRKLKWR